MRHSALGVKNPNVERLNWWFGHTLDSSAIDHLLDWDNHLLAMMIFEYVITIGKVFFGTTGDFDTWVVIWDENHMKPTDFQWFWLIFMNKGKSLRLQNSSKRPQNPSKRLQKQSNAYKSQKVGQPCFLQSRRICFKIWYFHKLQPSWSRKRDYIHICKIWLLNCYIWRWNCTAYGFIHDN